MDGVEFVHVVEKVVQELQLDFVERVIQEVEDFFHFFRIRLIETLGQEVLLQRSELLK